jgi:hypothetical protein
MTSENDTNNINLQLGDIIKFEAPTNSNLHEKIFIIDLINSEKINLKNEVNSLTLEFKNKIFLEESIKKIHLLFRHESPSYIKQNNITIDKIISIYFGGKLPFILNGKIVNIEDDMIEIKDIKSDKIYFIDFAYSGIPENLNIEKIVLRSSEEDISEIKKSDIKEEEINDDKIDKISLQNVKDYDDDLNVNNFDEFNEIILDNIEFGEKTEEIYYNVEVPDKEKRYLLDEQIEDYLDSNLNSIKKENLDDIIKDRIFLESIRFKELRNLYSDFDLNNIPSMKEEKNNFYKPLKEVLLNLSKKLYWLLPIGLYKRNIYIDDLDDDIDNNYVKNETGKYIEDLISISKKWEKKSSKDTLYTYEKYINELYEKFDNNVNNYNVKKSLNNNMHILNDNFDDFQSIVINKGKLEKKSFVIDHFGTNIKMKHTSDVGNKKKYITKDFIYNNEITIGGFLTLPQTIMNFSKINLEYTSILERSSLNLNYLNYFKILNKNSIINKFIIDDFDKEQFINTNNNIYKNNELFNNINSFTINSIIDSDYSIYYNHLLESFIPTTNNIIEFFNNNKQYVNNNSLNNDLQIFNITFNDLHDANYNIIKNMLESNIINYIKTKQSNNNKLTSLISELNSNNNKYLKTIYKNSFNLISKELKTELFNNYNIDNELYNNDELYSHFIKLDGGAFLFNNLNKTIMDLIVSNLLDNFIKQKDKTIKEDKKLDSNNCEKYFLSKKYKSLDDLNEDNNKLIYFDVIYDNTYYGLINEYSNQKESMDSKEFLNFLKTEIENKMNMTKEQALREAKAIIEEQKEVIDGDYCLLIDKVNNKNVIYIRKDNIWIIDEQFKDNFYIDSNKIFCDSNKDCLYKDEKCKNKSQVLNKSMREDVDEILKTFNIEYDISIEEIKKKLNISYEKSKKYLNNISKIKKKRDYSTNNNLLKLNSILNNLKIISSPYENLRDYILNYPDFNKRQVLIKTFCLRFTREAINNDDKKWLYCNNTGVKLIPDFLLKLANVFLSKGDYLLELDTICANQGTISDDNNYWVDKHSGYIIKNIDFSSDEGYDEKGFKLNTKELIEEFNLFNEEKDSGNSTINMIKYIINGLTNNMDINLDNHKEFIIQNVMKLINKTVPSKQQYDKLILETAKKEGKIKKLPDYEETYNLSLLVLTLSFIIICILINIPKISAKKTFPGCVRFFDGYPLIDDNKNIVYISCIACKMKSSIKPWNSILKINESVLVKKITSVIDKFILTNKDIVELIEIKKEYIKSEESNVVNIVDEEIKWHYFYPPLKLVKIDSKELLPLSSDFNDYVLENIKKAKINNDYDVINSKIFFLSISILESIENIILKQDLILKNNNEILFLENSCCYDEKNVYSYLNNNDKTIIEKNSLLGVYKILKNGINELNKASIIYHNKNNKLTYPKLDNYFSEKTIYKSFIYYCNFNNNLPIDDELKAICLNKPTEILKNIDINEAISNLKSQGKNYNKSNFEDLLNLINKRNINIVNNKKIISNFEIIRNILTNYKNQEEELFYEKITNKLEEVLDSYTLMSDGSLTREIKNYILSNNNITKNNILASIKRNSTLSKQNYLLIEDALNINFTINDHNFVINYINNLLKIFPNIITNKNINYNDVPKHWNLSEVHNNDIYNILKKYYLPLMSSNVFPEFNKIFEIVENKTKILIELLHNTHYKNNIEIKDYKKTITLYSVFDKLFIESFYKFIFLNIINDILDIANSEEFLLLLPDIDESVKNDINNTIINYLLTFFGIMKQHYKLISNSYNKVKQNILITKEKEKDLITDYLKDLTQEERDIETIFKNNKLEKWSKGLQKGLTQYVKENYDEERAELEKQALKEHLLNKKSNVTDMNKEIYKMDIEEEMARAEEIEDEEYNMNNIPDDDDYSSDYEYDY